MELLISRNDLFEFTIDCTYQLSIDSFIKFIKNLRDSKGWYFNSHYMHSKIKIRDPIVVNINDIDTLYAYVDLLKSTQVILCKKDTHNSKVQYESSTLNTNCNHILLVFKNRYLHAFSQLILLFKNRSKIKKFELFYF